RDVLELDAGLALEELERKALRAARPRRAVVELSRARPGVGDELLRRRAGYRRMYGQSPRHVRHHRDAGEVAQRLYREFREHARVDRHSADVAEQYRMAVGAGAGRDLDPDVAGSAAAIVDHDLLAQAIGDFRRDDARHEIGSAAGAERHNYADR